MLYIFVIISLSLMNIYNYSRLVNIEYYKYKVLEEEVKEYRKIKRKLNKWRFSQDKIIEILDKGIYRLKQLRLNIKK
jgi:hypothetical protein